MANVALERQFAGQARLVRLLLWRVGDSTDIDRCLAAALEQNMIGTEDEAFLREALAAEEAQREGDGLSLALDDAYLARLRRCADKLNRADAA